MFNVADERVIDMRRWTVAVEGDVLMCTRGDRTVDVRLDAIRSVLWSRVPLLPRSVLKWGLLVLFIPFIAMVFLLPATTHTELFEASVFDSPTAVVLPLLLGPTTGFVLILAYTLMNGYALDIDAGGEALLIAGPRDDLARVKRRIDVHRVSHGRRDDVAEDALLDGDDEAIYERIEREGVGGVSLLEDVDACTRCGSLEIRPPTASDGGVPGVFDVQGQVYCPNCHLTAVPLSFADVGAYEGFLSQLATLPGGWYQEGRSGPADRFRDGNR